MTYRRTPLSVVRTVCVAALAITAAPLSAQPPLEISSPYNGQQFRPGETVTITVRTTRQYQYVGIIAATPLTGYQMLNAEPYRFSLALSPDLPAGLYTITAIGAPGSPGSVGFDDSVPVEIDVEPIWRPSSDASQLVRDAPGVTVETGGIPLSHRSAIAYPSAAIAQGLEGTVVAEIIPDWEGHVEGVHVLSGPVPLARHVIQSVSTWHYAAGVGEAKPRRVSITFNLADAKLPVPGGAADPPLTDNTTYAFWTSMAARSRRFSLRKIAILGLSEIKTRELTAYFEKSNIREGEVVPFDTLSRIRAMPQQVDTHLRTYFRLEGSQLWATIAPIGFRAGDSGEKPPIQTERVPPGVDPGRLYVSAVQQARKLISQTPPQYPWLAKARYIQGVVRVHVVIGENGRVLNTETTGPLGLCRPATEAVEQWIYSPTVVNGHAAEVISEVYVEFFLPY